MKPIQRERYWPAWVSVIVASGMAVALTLWALPDCPVVVPVATMTFGVVTSGFTATQRNMLIGMKGAEVLAYASRTGFGYDLLGYLRQGSMAGVAVIVISLIGVFGAFYSWPHISWMPLLTGAISFVACVTYRNERIMHAVVERFVESQGKSEV